MRWKRVCVDPCGSFLVIGSILSNLLLVLGMCFFAGGMKYSEQGFGASKSNFGNLDASREGRQLPSPPRSIRIYGC